MTWGEIEFLLTKRLPGEDPAVVRAELNAAYTEILDDRPWKGLESSARLQTVAAYETGTLTVVNGSKAITLAGGTFLAEMDGRKIRIATRTEFYIFTYTGATTGTLDRGYEGDGASAAAFKIFQDEYVVDAGVKAVTSMSHLAIGYELGDKTSKYLDQIDPAHQHYGDPRLWAPIEDTAEGQGPVLHAIRVWPVPTTVVGYEYGFLRAAFELDNTPESKAASPLPFVSPHALIARVEAQLAKDKDQASRAAAKYTEQIQKMHHQENMRTPPQPMRLSDRWTRVWRERGLR